MESPSMEFLESVSKLRQHLEGVGVVHFLQLLQLLRTEKKCGECRAACRLESKKAGREPMWRCSNRSCRKRFSLREQSFFCRFQSPLEKVLEVLLGWIKNHPTSVIVTETGLSKPTVIRFLNVFRELISAWLEETAKKLGGSGHLVELEESPFGRRKMNRGASRKANWVLGGIDRSTKETFFVRLDRRDVKTVQQVLLTYVRPGTAVQTDFWNGYQLDGLGFFQHMTTKSPKFLVDSQNRHHDYDHHVHELLGQHELEDHLQPQQPDLGLLWDADAQWAKRKRDLRRRVGRMSPTTYEAFIVEFIWRNRCGGQEDVLFRDFCTAAHAFYQ